MMKPRPKLWNNSGLNQLIQIGIRSKNRDVRALSRRAQKELYAFMEAPIKKPVATLKKTFENFNNDFIEAEPDAIGVRGAIHIVEIVKADGKSRLTCDADGHFDNPWNRDGALMFIIDQLDSGVETHENIDDD